MPTLRLSEGKDFEAVRASLSVYARRLTEMFQESFRDFDDLEKKVKEHQLSEEEFWIPKKRTYEVSRNALLHQNVPKVCYWPVYQFYGVRQARREVARITVE